MQHVLKQYKALVPLSSDPGSLLPLAPRSLSIKACLAYLRRTPHLLW